MQHAVAQVFVGIDLEVKEDAISALELLSRSHFDAFIVECDTLEHATEIIPAIRSTRANRRSVIFTIVNGNPLLLQPWNSDRISLWESRSILST